MNKDKLFWNNLSNIYNKMFGNSKSYYTMYSLMAETLKPDMNVLEVGTASGLVARAIANKVKNLYAIDFSEDMIAKAKEITTEKNIYFSVQDSTNLEFNDKSFDAVIIANVLHIVEKPEICLTEIKRVLKDNGILIAPTYLWKEMSFIGKIQKLFMQLKKFPIYSTWNTEEYINFLQQNNFEDIRHKTIKGRFNICYVECKYNK